MFYPFLQQGKEVHIPGCIEMKSEECVDLAKGIVQEQPHWFKDGENTNLVSKVLEDTVPAEMAYYKLGLPVLADSAVADDNTRYITGVAGDCKFIQYVCAFGILVD